jgi:hypothetical protein
MGVLFIVGVPSVSINGIGNGVGLNSPRTALTQQQITQANLTIVEEQQQLMEGISFQIDNLTFSHHILRLLVIIAETVSLLGLGVPSLIE